LESAALPKTDADLEQRRIDALSAELGDIRQKLGELHLRQRKPNPGDQVLGEQLRARAALIEDALTALRAERVNRDQPSAGTSS
jgi:hypothetical protein